MIICVIILISSYIYGTCGLPSYDYDCEGTFHPENSSLYVSDTGKPLQECRWKFETNPDETFRIAILDLGKGRFDDDCSTHFVAIRVGQRNIKHCGNVQTPYIVETLSNVVTLHYWKKRRYVHFTFRAYLTRDIRSKLRVVETPMTWTEADVTCKGSGGHLAESYPVVSKQLKQLVQRRIQTGFLSSGNYQAYWIGKSLTPWVMLLGCVKLKEDSDCYKAYTTSKYNQMSECAMACAGNSFVLVQKTSCYCAQEENGFDFVPYRRCDYACPGLSRERCGGWNVFTLYKYYNEEVETGDRSYNCISQQGEIIHRKQTACDTALGFSCELNNGSVVTYNPNIPGRRESLSFYKAVEFCAGLSDSVGMAPVPEYQHPYFSEPYWTTITRSVDWNFDTITKREPVFSLVATLNGVGSYIERTRNSSEKHGFICLKESAACGHDESADSGNLTSPGYPLPYQNHRVCEWRITVNETKTVRLLIQDMDIEEGPGCSYDYLLVKVDDASGERFCGRMRMKYISSQNYTVTLVFRTDNTRSGKGFSLSWSAVDHNFETGHPSRELSSISGGAVVGITVAVVSVLVILVSLLVSVVYLKRHPRKDLQDREETSTAHNAVYAMSSFNTSSLPEGDSMSYQNVSQRRAKLNIKAEISYANDPNKMKEKSTNVYESIRCKNEDSIADVNLGEGYKACLLLDSDNGSFCSSENPECRGKVSTGPIDTIGGATGTGQLNTFNIFDIDNIGKDCIKVVNVETSTPNEMTGDAGTYNRCTQSPTAYTYIAFEGTANSLDNDEEETYLNEELTSNVHMPHYEDIPESTEDTQQYIQIDHTQAVENRTSHTYLQL